MCKTSFNSDGIRINDLYEFAASVFLLDLNNLTIEIKQHLRRTLLNCNFKWQKFILDNSKCFDVISLLVKYYVPVAHINKIIKLLKFKSAMNLQCF